MIRHTKLPKDILGRIDRAANYLEKRNDVYFAYLFGGLSKGEPKPLSDVDIAVYLSENADSIQAKSEIVEKLVDILLTDEIDVVILNQSSLPLSMNVLKHNRLLVDKKPFLRHAYQSLITRKYFDYHHLESNILKRRFYHGR
ncbi:MAG: nucleotidyltransferase domain-containing protein [Desulfosarcina sp.]|nr:nucleotidyltransferase domain-containing protein [Desulfosarcina sp.]